MKRILIATFLLLLLPTLSYPYFSITGPADWYETRMKQISCEVEVLGLFHQVTITFQVEPVPHCDYSHNCAVDVNVYWNFGLTSEAVLTGCWLKPPGATEFTEAQLTDLTSAEEAYGSNPNARPALLLRQMMGLNWNGEFYKSYEMRVNPVAPSRPPVIKIRYIAPCWPYYQARRLWLPLGDFSVTYPCNLDLYYLNRDNLSEHFHILDGYPESMSWTKPGDFHKTTLLFFNNLYNYRNYGNILFVASAEAGTRSYLRIYEEPDARFYQLSFAPPIRTEDQKPRNILLAVDLSDRTGYYSEALSSFRKTVGISTSPRDSITMVYSGFTPVVFDTLFQPVNETRLAAMFGALRNAPVLNTLPHLLRSAVDLFNRSDRGGELWVISDAFGQCKPPQAAMEIVGQTVQQLKHSVAFRILGAGYTGESVYINNQYYWGNDYLYEILARLSRGSFISLRNYPSYSFLDAMLDCIAPTAAAAEIDPLPGGGLTYSRFSLNRGRSDFPIGIPWFEIGLMDGNAPFNLRYFCSLEGGLFSRDTQLERVEEDPGWRITADYWYSLYIRNLLLEPQSHETISYIEDVSVSHRILTPYSGFIIPGRDGLLAFSRLDAVTDAASEEKMAVSQDVQKTIEFSAFPNPFNDATTFSLRLPQLDAGEKVEIFIINTLGQVVRSWSMPSGSMAPQSELRWDSRDETGQSVPSGIYLVLVRAGEQVRHTKITLMK